MTQQRQWPLPALAPERLTGPAGAESAKAIGALSEAVMAWIASLGSRGQRYAAWTEPHVLPVEVQRLRPSHDDLLSEIKQLRQEVAELREALARRPLSTEATFLASVPGVKLLHPIPVVISECEDDEWVVSWPETTLYGSGDTYHEALKMFRDEVATLVEDVREGNIPRDGFEGKVVAEYVEV